MKRIIGLILALSILLGMSAGLTLTANAAGGLYVHDVFSPSTANSDIKSWSVPTEGGKTAGLDEEAGGFARLTYEKGLPYIEKCFNTPLKGTFVMSMKARAGAGRAIHRLFAVKDNKNNYSELLSLTREGKIKAGATELGSYEREKWNSYALIINTVTKQYDVYVNGELVREKMRMPNPSVQGIYLWRIQTHDGDKTTLDMKEINFYESDVFLTNEELEGVQQVDIDSLAAAGEASAAMSKISSATAMVLSSGTAMVNGVRKKVDTDSRGVKAISKNGNVSVPVRFVAESLGLEVIWDQEAGATKITGNETNIIVKTGSETMEVKDEIVTLSQPVYEENGKQLAPLNEYIEALGKKLFFDEKGLIVISDKDNILDSEKDAKTIDEIITTISYERPKANKILTDLKRFSPDNQHPRILANAGTFERIKEGINTNPHIQRMYADIKEVADTALTRPITTYMLSGEEVAKMSSSGTMRAILEPLIMVYKITGDEKYAFRAWQELEAVSKYPDWNESHFLDCAEMSGAVGLGYDWLYDYLNDEQRALIRKGLMEKGLAMARSAYDGSASGGYNRKGFPTSLTNWNYVCNAGIAMGALAIADEEEEMCGYILENGLKSIELVLHQFGPDGAWAEGLGYWSYTVRYLANYMASMESALGTHYGYYNIRGIDNTGYYPVYLSGPKGQFNFGNAGTGFINAPELFFFAMMQKDPDLAGLRLQLLETQNLQTSIRDLIWYDPAECSEKVELNLDAMFGKANVGSMRSGWDDYANFVAFRCGNNQTAHAHMDNGGFIFDALGERFIDDLGAENYDLPGFWDKGNGADQRGWHLYKNRTEGHNTLVFNPSLEPGQDAFENGDYTRLDFYKKNGGIAVMDITAPYKDYVDSLQRGFFLADNRRILVVQDEFKAKEASNVWSFLQTKANITIQPDGKSAIFEIKGKKLYVTAKSSAGTVKMTKTSADSMPTSPLSQSPEKQNNRSMYSRLCININNVKDATLTMMLIPLDEAGTIPQKLPDYGAISTWKIEADAELPALSEISVSGEALKGFDKDTYNYVVELPYGTTEIPELFAKGDEHTIEMPASAPGTAKITLAATAASTIPVTYKVEFKVVCLPPVQGISEGMNELTITEATMADFEEQNAKNNHANRTLDGNTGTSWSDNVGQWVQYDLGSAQDMSGVAMSFYNGNRSRYMFDVETSIDGTSWTKVYYGSNSRTTVGLETFAFNTVSARYVRVISGGSTESSLTTISEFKALGSVQ